MATIYVVRWEEFEQMREIRFKNLSGAEAFKKKLEKLGIKVEIQIRE